LARNTCYSADANSRASGLVSPASTSECHVTPHDWRQVLERLLRRLELPAEHFVVELSHLPLL